MIIKAIIILSAAGLIFITSMLILVWLSNRKFRKNAKADWRCKLYDDEIKCTGTILRRDGDKCYVEFLDGKAKYQQRYFHIENLYSAW